MKQQYQHIGVIRYNNKTVVALLYRPKDMRNNSMSSLLDTRFEFINIHNPLPWLKLLACYLNPIDHNATDNDIFLRFFSRIKNCFAAYFWSITLFSIEFQNFSICCGIGVLSSILDSCKINFPRLSRSGPLSDKGKQLSKIA